MLAEEKLRAEVRFRVEVDQGSFLTWTDGCLLPVQHESLEKASRDRSHQAQQVRGSRRERSNRAVVHRAGLGSLGILKHGCLQARLEFRVIRRSWAVLCL
jgi:hypothetical protein